MNIFNFYHMSMSIGWTFKNTWVLISSHSILVKCLNKQTILHLNPLLLIHKFPYYISSWQVSLPYWIRLEIVSPSTPSSNFLYVLFWVIKIVSHNLITWILHKGGELKMEQGLKLVLCCGVGVHFTKMNRKLKWRGHHIWIHVFDELLLIIGKKLPERFLIISNINFPNIFISGFWFSFKLLWNEMICKSVWSFWFWSINLLSIVKAWHFKRLQVWNFIIFFSFL